MDINTQYPDTVVAGCALVSSSELSPPAHVRVSECYIARFYYLQPGSTVFLLQGVLFLEVLTRESGDVLDEGVALTFQSLLHLPETILVLL